MAFPRLATLTNNLKTLQPRPESVEQGIYDMLISMATDKIINDVSAFTNTPVDELPPSLDSAMLIKLSGWFTDTGVFLSDKERQTGRVTGITEGDTSISYGSPQATISALGGTSFVDGDFRIQLMRYRRLRG